MRLAVLKETTPGEHRVALVPESCKKLIQAGYTIAVERGAGDRAAFLIPSIMNWGSDSKPIRGPCSPRLM